MEKPMCRLIQPSSLASTMLQSFLGVKYGEKEKIILKPAAHHANAANRSGNIWCPGHLVDDPGIDRQVVP